METAPRGPQSRRHTRCTVQPRSAVSDAGRATVRSVPFSNDDAVSCLVGPLQDRAFLTNSGRGGRSSPLDHSRAHPSCFGVEVEVPRTSLRVSGPPTEVVADHSAAKLAKKNEDKLEGVMQKLDLKAFEYATWDGLDLAMSRKWKDETSTKRLKDFQM